MWEKIIELGKEMGIEPYGTEALSTLRIEMGHVAGSEIDGRTISSDLSLDGMLSKKKDFIGKRSLNRKAFIESGREKIVGVVPLDKKTMIPEGSHIVVDDKASLPNPKLGHISASCWSVEYNNPFSLAILKDGKQRIGEKLYALSPLKNKSIPVEIVSLDQLNQIQEYIIDADFQKCVFSRTTALKVWCPFCQFLDRVVVTSSPTENAIF